MREHRGVQSVFIIVRLGDRFILIFNRVDDNENFLVDDLGGSGASPKIKLTLSISTLATDDEVGGLLTALEILGDVLNWMLLACGP